VRSPTPSSAACTKLHQRCRREQVSHGQPSALGPPIVAFCRDRAYKSRSPELERFNAPAGVHGNWIERHRPAARLDIGLMVCPLLKIARRCMGGLHVHAYVPARSDCNQTEAFRMRYVESQIRVGQVRFPIRAIGKGQGLRTRLKI
jgi:hypothetical protein